MVSAAAYLLALAAVVVLLVGGVTKSIGVLLVGVVGLAATLVGGWWFLSNRGVVRWLGALVAVAAPVAVVVVYISQNLLLPIIVVVVLMGAAVAAARAAVVRARPPTRMPERETPPPRRPYVIMNPRSGGGKVGKFDLKDRAAALGATVALIEGPGMSTSPRWRATRSPAGPTCSAWLAATVRRRWSPALPPSTACRSW